jgi:hypothetical protein
MFTGGADCALRGDLCLATVSAIGAYTAKYLTEGELRAMTSRAALTDPREQLDRLREALDSNPTAVQGRERRMTRASPWDRRYAQPVDPVAYNEKRSAEISALIHHLPGMRYDKIKLTDRNNRPGIPSSLCGRRLTGKVWKTLSASIFCLWALFGGAVQAQDIWSRHGGWFVIIVPSSVSHGRQCMLDRTVGADKNLQGVGFVIYPYGISIRAVDWKIDFARDDLSPENSSRYK